MWSPPVQWLAARRWGWGQRTERQGWTPGLENCKELPPLELPLIHSQVGSGNIQMHIEYQYSKNAAGLQQLVYDQSPASCCVGLSRRSPRGTSHAVCSPAGSWWSHHDTRSLCADGTSGATAVWEPEGTRVSGVDTSHNKTTTWWKILCHISDTMLIRPREGKVIFSFGLLMYFNLCCNLSE